MRRRLPLIALLGALLWVACTLIPGPGRGAWDHAGFGRLPVLADGRMKPLDTVARTSLLMFQGRQRVVAGKAALSPEDWLLDVLFLPEAADALQVFRVDNDEVLSLFNLAKADGEGGVRFSFAQLRPGLDELERQARLADPVDSSARTAFQAAVVELQGHVDYYQRLRLSFQPAGADDLAAVVSDPSRLQGGRTGFESMATFSPLRPVPPSGPGQPWVNVGRALLDASAGAPLSPAVRAYAEIGRAWRAGQPAAFNAAVAALAADDARFPDVVRRCSAEAFFNRAEPFVTAMMLYVVAFLLAVFAWLAWPEALGSAAFRFLAVAFVLATAGILARMWLESRPPVTNLYSSALFIGWGSVALCLVLERLHRNAVASAAGGLIGFGTLVIAHHLSLSGDTMEMMRAVLDSNFWLSTHVVTVTVGYASTFLAGFLAIIYLLRGTLTRSLDARTAASLARMVYGIVCFATLFSFVGTTLGGIWADQSWGRFWGWDPKENGALIIVIWNAIILHCRWAGLVRQRGLMALAVFGNVVTAWSWFGTNMLGVGLHSYGFTEAAFQGLVGFVASQLAVILLAAIPRSRWRSPQADPA
jgi:ABC-type transport system involved in cytochrome c biogenesis permease subunit